MNDSACHPIGNEDIALLDTMSTQQVAQTAAVHEHITPSCPCTSSVDLVLSDTQVVELILLPLAGGVFPAASHAREVADAEQDLELSDEFDTRCSTAAATGEELDEDVGTKEGSQFHAETSDSFGGAVMRLADFAALALVSKAFASACASDLVWRTLCCSRWRTKWGFCDRLGRAERAVKPAQSGWWRQRFRAEETDGVRKHITVSELHRLVFDFRFWLGQQPAPGRTHGGLPFVPAGVRTTASNDFRFKPHTSSLTRREESKGTDSADEYVATHRGSVASGNVSGHPSGHDGFVWYLRDSSAESTAIQWGYPSNLFPCGRIQRLPSWGWEIQNPNVVLRAREPTYLGADGSDERGVAGSASQTVNDLDAEEKLWGDMWKTCFRARGSMRDPRDGRLKDIWVEVPRAYLRCGPNTLALILSLMFEWLS